MIGVWFFISLDKVLKILYHSNVHLNVIYDKADQNKEK